MDESRERDRSGTPVGREPESPGLTRRQWILRLGEATALAGFSGAIPETLASPLTVPSKELPPGLYAPSGEHMAHVLLREDRFVTPPAGTETEYAAAATSPFEPVFFSREE